MTTYRIAWLLPTGEARIAEDAYSSASEAVFAALLTQGYTGVSLPYSILSVPYEFHPEENTWPMLQAVRG